jgi:hypothetical protein
MPIITSVIAKGLVILDELLGYFATVSVHDTQNICGRCWVILDAELTSCGEAFVQDLVRLITGLIYFGLSLIEGLLAV